MGGAAGVPRALVALLLAGALVGCGSAGREVVGTGDAGRDPATAAPTTAPTTAPPSEPGEQERPRPSSVSIASLDLTEDLVDLGLDDGGTLEVPEDPDRVGWFTGGGRPGGPGPTVVVGHVDSTEGPAVFARLPELVPGDEVVVADEAGGSTTYAVSEVADVPQSPFPTEEVFGATAEDTLRLITCTGPYDEEAGRYTENRVVTAVTVD